MFPRIGSKDNGPHSVRKEFERCTPLKMGGDHRKGRPCPSSWGKKSLPTEDQKERRVWGNWADKEAWRPSEECKRDPSGFLLGEKRLFIRVGFGGK